MKKSGLMFLIGFLVMIIVGGIGWSIGHKNLKEVLGVVLIGNMVIGVLGLIGGIFLIKEK